MMDSVSALLIGILPSAAVLSFKKVSNVVHSIKISDHGKWSLIMIDTIQVLIVKVDFLFGHTCWHDSPKG
jgi:hypothetical protein